jgi:succinoglycan biosynthesis protein ExoM
MSRHVAICVATYRRPKMLRRLLDSLAAMQRPADTDVELRLVDNDSEFSSEPAVRAFTAHNPWPLRTAIERQQNIALARNRALEMGPTDFVVFVDDDEVVPERWLQDLLDCAERTGADGAFGPVQGRVPVGAPEWTRRGGFFDKSTGPQDAEVAWGSTRTSNTLVRGSWFYEKGLRFDAGYGRSGSSDTDLFVRMAVQGALFASAESAGVWEDVEPQRACFRWLWKRYYRNGLTYHRLCRNLAGPPHPGGQLLRRLLKMAFLCFSSLPGLLLGRCDRFYHGLFVGALAMGGMVAWLRPARATGYVEYGTRKKVATEAPAESPPAAVTHVDQR